MIKKRIILIGFSLWFGFNFVIPLQATTSTQPPLTRRHPDAGVWVDYRGNNTEKDLNKDYIKGVMVYDKWYKIYRGRHNFNWNTLGRELDLIINKAGKKAFISIDAGYCPGLDWPEFLKERIAHHREKHRKGCYPLQFWDPEYIKLYKEYIQALANYLAAFDANDRFPNETNILFVRAQVMAVTMENLPQRNEVKQGKWKWQNFVPAPNGHIYKEDLTIEKVSQYHREIALAYQTSLQQAYQKYNLPPPVPVAKAGDLWSIHPERDFFIENQIWFDAHSAQPSPFGWYYEMILKVKQEQSNRATTEPDHYPRDYLSQYTYWTMLANLHSGIEFIGIYGRSPNSADIQPKGPLSWPPNQEILKFTSRYAGYEREPTRSPGAWIALRGYYPQYRWSKIHHDALWSNYQFLMRQYRPQDSVALFGVANRYRSSDRQLVPFVERSERNPWSKDLESCYRHYPPEECQFIIQHPDKLVEEENGKFYFTFSPTDLGEVLTCDTDIFCSDPNRATLREPMIYARRTDKENNHHYLRFDLNDQFAQSLRGRARIRIVYLDQGYGQWQLLYDAQNNPEKIALTVKKENTNFWKEAWVTLNDIRFQNRQTGGTDLALYNSQDDDDIFHLIEVQRLTQGDLNLDNRVNAIDYQLFFQFQSSQDLMADLNQDQKIDQIDLHLLLQEYH